MADTAIEWTDKVWNPTTGCDRVSPGCDNCYALTLAKRLKGMGSAKYQNDGDPRTSGPGFGITEHPDSLTAPFSWRTPQKVFVNSMSDLFHDGVADDFLARVFAVMAATPQHTYQILTKRHARMRSFLSDLCRCGSGHAAGIHLRSAMSWAVSKANPDRIEGPGATEEQVYYEAGWPLRNVWLGVSAENQKWFDIRWSALRQTPAVVRWVSFEPLLGPINFAGYSPLPDWAVAGGESGPGARPMHPDWARSLRDQCVAAGVPFLFKQWGEWGPAPWSVPVCDPAVGWQGTDDELVTAKRDAEARGATHHIMPSGYLYKPDHKPWSLERDPDGDYPGAVRRWGKKAAGRELDGREWSEYPEVVS